MTSIMLLKGRPFFVNNKRSMYEYPSSISPATIATLTMKFTTTKIWSARKENFILTADWIALTTYQGP